MAEVCSISHEEVNKIVPASVKQRVFQEYGIANAGANEYEIDYLIAPGLGGTDDIQNLWPEPYHSHRWNAYVKDALEEHLHQLVCQGKVNLDTAQHDIASDWIAAYKRYFHTERPTAPAFGRLSRGLRELAAQRYERVSTSPEYSYVLERNSDLGRTPSPRTELLWRMHFLCK